MKEVINWNNRPREMWVWDDDESQKIKRKVIAIIGGENPVIATSAGYDNVSQWKHCAEVSANRLMSNKELSFWLSDKPRREWRMRVNSSISRNYSYIYEREDEPVSKEILVRENGGKWREPLAED